MFFGEKCDSSWVGVQHSTGLFFSAFLKFHASIDLPQGERFDNDSKMLKIMVLNENVKRVHYNCSMFRRIIPRNKFLMSSRIVSRFAE